MRKLAILGASGHGTVVAYAALGSGWDCVVFYDDAWPELRAVGAWPVVGTRAALLKDSASFESAIVAVGDNHARLSLYWLLAGHGVPQATVIHPSARVSRFAVLGAGSMLAAGAIVGPFAVVGDAAIINTAATVDHHCNLGDGVHVSPGAHIGGAVTLRERAWIGIGASVRQGITIGVGATVGAGAVVVAPVGDGVTVVGVPAKPIVRAGT